MLRIHANTSSSGAKSYYTKADYYSQGQELIGRWRGQGAEMLGLRGDVQQKDWDALCDNKDPSTNKRLTVRTQAVRRVGYDFTFSAPKGLSLLYAMTKDERLLDAFRSAVDETMHAMEPEMKARVRLDGKDEDRVTGNMVWGEYVHLTGRPVDGVPDPQLHAHCFVFNVTKDPHESRWKAGQFGDLSTATTLNCTSLSVNDHAGDGSLPGSAYPSCFPIESSMYRMPQKRSTRFQKE